MEGAGVIVLDTHTLLWMDRDDPALGQTARRLIEDAWRAGQIAVSASSFRETAMLAQRGRIVLPLPASEWRSELLQAGVREIALDGRIGILASQLEDLHRDPANRFIVATSLQQQATLITADENLLKWQSELVRQDARV